MGDEHIAASNTMKVFEAWENEEQTFFLSKYCQMYPTRYLATYIMVDIANYILSCCTEAKNVFMLKWFPILLVEMHLMIECPFTISNAFWF